MAVICHKNIEKGRIHESYKGGETLQNFTGFYTFAANITSKSFQDKNCTNCIKITGDIY